MNVTYDMEMIIGKGLFSEFSTQRGALIRNRAFLGRRALYRIMAIQKRITLTITINVEELTSYAISYIWGAF